MIDILPSSYKLGNLLGEKKIVVEEIKIVNIEKNRIKLKDFLTLINDDMLVDIVYRHMSECGFIASEIFIKRPELENTYIKEKGIAIYANKLDYILAENSNVRKEEFFQSVMQNEYEYLLIEVED